VRFYFVSGVEQNKVTFNTSIIHLFFIQLVCIALKNAVIFLMSKKFSLRFVKHFQFHISAFVNMECKENDVNDADIDDRFPADIEKAANRATLTFINK
jgi:hypothetical protein